MQCNRRRAQSLLSLPTQFATFATSASGWTALKGLGVGALLFGARVGGAPPALHVTRWQRAERLHGGSVDGLAPAADWGRGRRLLDATVPVGDLRPAIHPRGSHIAAPQAADRRPRAHRARALAGDAALVGVALGGCSATLYTLPAQIDANVPLTVMVDSGSSDLVVASSLCDASCDAVQPDFEADAEGDSGAVESLSYGSAQTSGEGYTRQVQLPSQPAVTLTLLALQSQQGLLNAGACYGDQTAAVTPQGLMGVGPDRGAQTGPVSVVGALSTAGVPPIFATQLCDIGGAIWFGNYNPQATVGPARYTPLDTTAGYHAINIQAMAIGDQDLGLPTSDNAYVVDTGTNNLYLRPEPFARAIAVLDPAIEALTGQTQFFNSSRSCIKTQSDMRAQIDAALPNFELQMEDTQGQAFVLNLLPTRSYLGMIPNTDGSAFYCPALLEDSSPSGGLNILPNLFLSSHVVIFDQVHAQLGFAPQNYSTCPQVIGLTPAVPPAPGPAAPMASAASCRGLPPRALLAAAAGAGLLMWM